MPNEQARVPHVRHFTFLPSSTMRHGRSSVTHASHRSSPSRTRIGREPACC